MIDFSQIKLSLTLIIGGQYVGSISPTMQHHSSRGRLPGFINPDIMYGDESQRFLDNQQRSPTHSNSPVCVPCVGHETWVLLESGSCTMKRYSSCVYFLTNWPIFLLYTAA